MIFGLISRDLCALHQQAKMLSMLHGCADERPQDEHAPHDKPTVHEEPEGGWKAEAGDGGGDGGGRGGAVAAVPPLPPLLPLLQAHLMATDLP